MTNSQHTPGPWKAQLYEPFVLGGDSRSIEALTPDGKYVTREICTLMLDTDEHPDGVSYLEDVANAYLIAAAPELLQVAHLGVVMREAQNRYFRERSQANLIASKQAEAAFDKAARAALDKAQDTTQEAP